MSDLSGMSKAERAKKRQMYLDRALARARQKAAVCERSLKCGPPINSGWPARHAGEPDGCKNDGTNCLCECHDPKEQAA